VRIYCSLEWLVVSVSPHRYSRSNPYMFADELALGQSCLATEIQTYVYRFVYLVSACGIRTQVISENVLLIQTELYYTPRDGHSNPEKAFLTCITSQKSVWITPVSTEDDIKLKTSHFMSDFQTTPEELGLLHSS
ncbi:Placenta-specific 1-like protein, partial [Heterocephalus glaber]